MSWLKKLGLVEDECPTVDLVVDEVVSVEQPVNVEVNVDIDSPTDVVAEIYEQNGLADKNDSIYTVQALINTLPETMTTATKQTTVAGILAVSGKSVETLLDDAQNRTNVLEIARDEIVDENTRVIEEANRDIEAMKEAIEAANIKIKEASEIIAATNKSIDDEKAAIDGLVKFCEGMNK